MNNSSSNWLPADTACQTMLWRLNYFFFFFFYFHSGTNRYVCKWQTQVWMMRNWQTAIGFQKLTLNFCTYLVANSNKHFTDCQQFTDQQQSTVHKLTVFPPKSAPYHSLFFLINLFILFIYFWLRWVFAASSSCGERGLLFVVVRSLLTAVAFLVAEQGF